LSRKFLHTNSTSHTGPFSAFAELIDNAYDPDVDAKQIWIDKTKIRDMECLTFRDDGNGLSRDLMHHMLSGSEMWENRASLSDILNHSPFNTEEELLNELRAIEGPTGTKIIIWNLRRTSEWNMGLDFTTENDIRIPCDDLDTSDASDTSVPESNTSLRKHKIPITFGYNTKSKEHYGLMMYYNNRLIKAYHRVGCQLEARNRKGIGVIGVIECNHLTPTNNKQDFVNTDIYRVLKLSFDHDNTTSTRPHHRPQQRALLVEQLEEEKASLSEDCEQKTARPETKMQGPRVKDEKKMNSSTAANDGAQVTAKAMISIIQDQQDQLMKLLQSVSNERDSFKEKVKELHAQLEVEKQCADCQTAREKARLHLKLSIQYLQNNCTSHRGSFSAIAELIESLRHVFTWLGFQVEVVRDATRDQMLSSMRELASRDHSGMDCVACVVLIAIWPHRLYALHLRAVHISCERGSCQGH
ncbi:unnamed protein product, partial [Gadus morhua 'NCC']